MGSVLSTACDGPGCPLRFANWMVRGRARARKSTRAGTSARLDRIQSGGSSGAHPLADDAPMLARLAAMHSLSDANHSGSPPEGVARATPPGTLGNPFVRGQMFYAEGWFRDPGAPKQTNLSDGLRFVLCE